MIKKNAILVGIGLLALIVIIVIVTVSQSGSAPVVRAATRIGGTEGGAATIDFALLDQARPLDLIEMDLKFPESLQALDGKKVKIIGFMAPYDSLDNLRTCMIVPSYVGCTFCSPPSLTQVLFVEQAGPPDSHYPFIEEPSAVSGILRLGDDHPAHQLGFVFVLENAVITPHLAPDAPRRAPGHSQPNAHSNTTATTPPLSPAELVAGVAELRGLQPLRPIEWAPVNLPTLTELVRSQTEARFPAGSRQFQARAFSLLGMHNQGAEWGAIMTGMALSERFSVTSADGGRISYLETAPLTSPHVRLGLVRDIAEALARQHFETARAALPGDGDAARALEAIRQGHRQIVSYRYASQAGLSPGSTPPTGLLPDTKGFPVASQELSLWHWLPWEAGPFFVDSRVGESRPLSHLDAIFQRPPQTTIEIFRPGWYDDGSLWRRDPVPVDFADKLLDTPPVYTDVLGLGGLVPWLTSAYPVQVGKQLCGNWAGDRYALWNLPDGESALLLETRWQNASAALEFAESLPDYPFQSISAPVNSTVVRISRARNEVTLQKLINALQSQVD